MKISLVNLNFNLIDLDWTTESNKIIEFLEQEINKSKLLFII